MGNNNSSNTEYTNSSEFGVVPMFRITKNNDTSEPADERKSSFASDSWETIIENVRSGNTSNYHVGDIRKISFNIGDVYSTTFLMKIVNMSTPNECKITSFSQSACGFVVELPFNRVVSEYSMNKSNTIDGGWANTNLRNSTIPSVLSYLNDLPNNVANTKIVAYKNRNTGELYATTDQYYIGSTYEYLPTTDLDEETLKTFDDYGLTRQLDYYKLANDAGNLDDAMERFFRTANSTSIVSWWNRSIINSTSFNYFGNYKSGVTNTSSLGLVLLFRLEGPSD